MSYNRSIYYNINKNFDNHYSFSNTWYFSRLSSWTHRKLRKTWALTYGIWLSFWMWLRIWMRFLLMLWLSLRLLLLLLFFRILLRRQLWFRLRFRFRLLNILFTFILFHSFFSLFICFFKWICRVFFLLRWLLLKVASLMARLFSTLMNRTMFACWFSFTSLYLFSLLFECFFITILKLTIVRCQSLPWFFHKSICSTFLFIFLN